MATQLTWPVTGMTCGGCENAVKRAVGLLPGVADVAASHAEATVQVTFDPALVSSDAIAQRMTKLGYQVGAPR